MNQSIDQRLHSLGIVLPSTSNPVASYIPFIQCGALLFISGQLPIWNGTLHYLGQIGDGLSLEDGQAAARLCALNILAQVKTACHNDLDRVVRCLKLGGFINARSDFQDHPKVMDGASGLMIDVFQAHGYHTRVAVGVSSLPKGVSVEVDALFEITF